MIMSSVDAQGKSDAMTQQAQQTSLEQQQKDLENKAVSEALKGFQQALQELP
jgi:hypothetical protein